jgi:hypothetical protein
MIEGFKKFFVKSLIIVILKLFESNINLYILNPKMARSKKSREGAHDELANEIGDEVESGEDETELLRATDDARQGKSVEIRDHKGRKLKIKVEKIDPATTVDDSEGYC